MAVGVMGTACRAQFNFRLPLLYCVPKPFLALQVRGSSSIAAVESPLEPWGLTKEELEIPIASHEEDKRSSKIPKWKHMNSKDLGIKSSMIAQPTKFVLKELKKKGYDVYLVGGCVRDLILNRTPKDFDIITSAELKEVLRTFPRSQLVGKRFPICHVHVKSTIVEVSSFSTSAKKSSRSLGKAFNKPSGCGDHDYFRWLNCSQRDFTINGFMFDPYAKTIYDYLGGMEDISNAKVRTVVPAHISFTEDCARILRAVRIAARLRFGFTREVAHAIRNLSWSVLRLDKGRIFMEMNYMLAYGSGESSLRLLWRFGLLEILIPFQAAYFVSHGFRRRDKRSNMLLSLFSELDRLVAPDRPCHSTLWIGILAFHKALIDKPRDPLVVAAFSLAIHGGGSLSEAVEIARKIPQAHDTSFIEFSKYRAVKDDGELRKEIVDFGRCIKDALSEMTDEYLVSKAMRKYPQAPQSDLVFISLASSLRVSRMFECVQLGRDNGVVHNRGSKIDYMSLAVGGLQELRHVFARIIFDTIYPPTRNGTSHPVNDDPT